MEAATARLGRGRKGRKQKSYGSEERRLATLLLSPAMAVIVLVAAYPIWYAVWTTFLFTGISVTLELAIGLGMALAMHAAFRGRGLLRTVVLVPWAVLTVVSAITWRTLFEPNLGLVPT